MSVLIKGMKIPRSCAECALTWVDDEYDKRCCITDKVVLGTIGRQDNANCTDHACPLVEIPPHGDLADKDKLMQEFMDSDLDHLQRDDWKEVIQIVADAPTIIEAEGSEDENNNV